MTKIVIADKVDICLIEYLFQSSPATYVITVAPGEANKEALEGQYRYIRKITTSFFFIAPTNTHIELQKKLSAACQQIADNDNQAILLEITKNCLEQIEDYADDNPVILDPKIWEKVRSLATLRDLLIGLLESKVEMPVIYELIIKAADPNTDHGRMLLYMLEHGLSVAHTIRFNALLIQHTSITPEAEPVTRLLRYIHDVLLDIRNQISKNTAVKANPELLAAVLHQIRWLKEQKTDEELDEWERFMRGEDTDEDMDPSVMRKPVIFNPWLTAGEGTRLGGETTDRSQSRLLSESFKGFGANGIRTTLG